MSTLSAATELLKLLGDPTRVRLLRLLAEEELSVVELTRATELVQSRVSTHLARLREAGLLRDRKNGTAVYYSLAREIPAEARRHWELLRDSVEDALLEQDRDRLQAARRGQAPTWADQVAGRMERHYSPGRTWESAARGLLGLATLGNVLDIASGDGALAELVAKRARSVTCLDRSLRVIRGGLRRLEHLPRLRFVAGDMHRLPLPEESFDQLMLLNSLCYADDPARVLREAARVAKPGAELAVTTLRGHEHDDVAEAYDHRQLGFEPDVLRRLVGDAGFRVELCEITSRERRPPHFEIVTLYARRAA